MKRFTVLMALFVLVASTMLAQESKAPGKKKGTKGEANAQVMSELQAMKDAIAAQQKQIEQLQQQVSQRDQVLQQNSQQLQQTQQQLVEAQKAANEANSKVSALESGQGKLQSDMTDVKTTLTNTATQTQDDQKRVSAVEGILGRFRMSGDVRVRYENFTQDKNDPTNANARELERNRPRLRVRFGIDGKLNEDFLAGFAIATGGMNDPTSPNQTLGDSFERKTINLDRGYITYQPHYVKGFSVTGGKWASNWQKTNQTFDPDINPDGFNERYSRDINNSVVKNVTVFAAQLYLNELSSTTLNADRDDSWAIGGGAQAKLQLGSRWTMTPSYSVFNFINPNYLVNGTLQTGNTALPVGLANNGKTPNYGGLFAPGANGFAPNGMTNAICPKVQANSSNTPALANAFCSDFLYSDIIVNNTIKTGLPKLPLNVLLEFEQNLNAKASNGGLALLSSPKTGAGIKKRDKLYVVDANFGQLKNKGDFQFGYMFIESQQDAVIASYAESDQFQPTNTRDNKIYLNYRVAPNTTISYTQWIGKYLDFNLTPTSFTKNTWLYRGQFDVIYSF